MLQAGRSSVRVPDKVDFLNLPNPSSRTMTLGSTQPLTEMSTRNPPGCGKRPARRADNLAAEYLRIWEPQPLATLRASTARKGIPRRAGLRQGILDIPRKLFVVSLK
jgi:hypothetical protein